MAKKFFTRNDIQEILERNLLKAKVFYIEREEKSSPDNVIIYYRLTPSGSLTADDSIHMRKVTIQVNHYHKKKLDNIEGLMLSNFMCEPNQLNLKQPDTDYLLTTFRFEVLTSGNW
ncbi:TPA: hypothetical protein ACIRGN_000893 [Streptococcus suis]|nr:hypothetical protein [Streptococcus suis]